MIIRALDGDNDWTFGRGKNDYLRENDAVAEEIATILRCFLGDCFFDVPQGIDWFNLLGTNNKLGLILQVKNKILNVEEVTGLIDLSVNLDENRNIFLQYSVSTVFSTQEPITKTVGVEIA